MFHCQLLVRPADLTLQYTNAQRAALIGEPHLRQLDVEAEASTPKARVLPPLTASSASPRSPVARLQLLDSPESTPYAKAWSAARADTFREVA